MRLLRSTPVLPLLLVLLACGGSRDCTAMGAVQGLLVKVAPALLAPAGAVEVQVAVCDDAGCVEGASRVPPGSAGRGPVVVDVGPAALGRDLEPGGAVADVALVDRRGETVAAATGVEVELAVQYPNGEGCEPDGVAGTVALRAADAV